MRAILRRKTGMSLVEDDARRDNLDAIELYHDVLTRVWERLRSGESVTENIGDLQGYAAAITHNVWSDYLRQRYPKRASLKNRLRYFLTHRSKYGVSESSDGELIAGFREWQISGVTTQTGRLAGFRDGTEKLRADSVPRRAIEQLAAEDWDRLLDALFARLGARANLDDAVGAVAQWVGVRAERFESLDEDLDDDDLAELGGLSAPEEKFCLLWKHLPLADTTIARLLELEREQVINRRMLAMRELARALGDAGQEPFSGTR